MSSFYSWSILSNSKGDYLAFLSYFTLSAYFNVLSVFYELALLGAMLPIMTVLQYPVNESLRTMVSLLPRKGVWFLFWSKARMHSLSASKLLLISAPSILVCFSSWSAWSAALSLPARSIKDIFPCSLFLRLRQICKMACDRDESLFVPFCEVTRAAIPNDMYSIKSLLLYILV